MKRPAWVDYAAAVVGLLVGGAIANYWFGVPASAAFAFVLVTLAIGYVFFVGSLKWIRLP